MQKYGYARVSSREQNLDRQIELLKQYIEDERYIICDKESGKDFNRRGYNSLVGTDTVAPRLMRGDLLIIVSLDRLGRNYTEIQQQWKVITQDIGADIKVLDMPLLDTSEKCGDLDRRFIADLVLQILAYTAEKERISIRTRQRQGIDTAKALGKSFGRPPTALPEKWEEIKTAYLTGQISASEAMSAAGMKKTTFYKMVKK